MNSFKSFETWSELLAHIRINKEATYYHAPLDVTPRYVTCTVTLKGNVRVVPFSSDADPFVADPAHLPRFCRKVGT